MDRYDKVGTLLDLNYLSLAFVLMDNLESTTYAYALKKALSPGLAVALLQIILLAQMLWCVLLMELRARICNILPRNSCEKHVERYVACHHSALWPDLVVLCFGFNVLALIVTSSSGFQL